MTNIQIRLTKCELNSHIISQQTTNNHMNSRVCFIMIVNNKPINNVYVNIAQPYGSDYNEDEIEVSRPYIIQDDGSSIEYTNLWDHALMCKEVSKYYKSIINKNNALISYNNVKNLNVNNNTIFKEKMFYMTISD